MSDIFRAMFNKLSDDEKAVIREIITEKQQLLERIQHVENKHRGCDFWEPYQFIRHEETPADVLAKIRSCLQTFCLYPSGSKTMMNTSKDHMENVERQKFNDPNYSDGYGSSNATKLLEATPDWKTCWPYLYTEEKKTEPDGLDTKFMLEISKSDEYWTPSLNGVTQKVATADGQEYQMITQRAFGFHTHSGYYGCFKPDQLEASWQIWKSFSADQLAKMHRVYATTCPHPCNAICCFHQETRLDRHSGITLMCLFIKCQPEENDMKTEEVSPPGGAKL